MTWNPMDLFRIFKGKADKPAEETLELNRAQIIGSDPNTMSMEEKFISIRRLNRFLDRQAPLFPSNFAKNSYLEANYKAEIDFGQSIYRSVEYSTDLRSTYDRIAREVAQDIYEFYSEARRSGELKSFGKMVPEERLGFAQVIANIYVDKTRELLIPKIQPVEVEASRANHGVGWVYISWESVCSGNHGSIHLNDKHLRDTDLGDFINTVCHEANHHTMAQYASLAEKNGKGDGSGMDVPDIHEKTIFAVTEMLKQDAITPSFIDRMYRSDPFERLAFRAGNGVETLFFKHHQERSLILDESDVRLTEILLDKDIWDNSRESGTRLLNHLTASPSVK